MLRTVIGTMVLMLCIGTAPAAPDVETAIVTKDQAALRAAPRASARQQAVL